MDAPGVAMTLEAEGRAGAPPPARRRRGRGRARAIGLLLAIGVVLGAAAAGILLRHRLYASWLVRCARAGDLAAWLSLHELDPVAARDALDLAIEVEPARGREGSPSHDALVVRIASRRLGVVTLPVSADHIGLSLEPGDGAREDARRHALHIDGCGARAGFPPPPGPCVVPPGGAIEARVAVGVFCALEVHSRCGPLLDERGSVASPIAPGRYRAVLSLFVPFGAVFDGPDVPGALAAMPLVLESAPFTLELDREAAR